MWLADSRYEVKSFATDNERTDVEAFDVFTGTRLGGGPRIPIRNAPRADDVYRHPIRW
jgi:hypothetical protein